MSEPLDTEAAAAGPRCGRCGRRLRPGFRLRGGDLRCGRHVIMHRAVWRRSLITAAIVGTILTAINQGNLIASHGYSREIVLKLCLTYCVPFYVSTSGGLGAAHIAVSDDRPEGGSPSSALGGAV